MNSQLIKVQTSDGLYLNGLHYSGADSSWGAILLHGTASNFYTSPLPELAEFLAKRGYQAITANNRGHDWISMNCETALMGSAFDSFAETPRDINAFIDYLKGYGCKNIILLGHSRGGAKIVHYQAETANPIVKGLVGISPGPMAAGSHMMTLPGFSDTFALAKRYVDEGQPNRLIRIQQWAGIDEVYCSAKTFVEKYTPSKYDGAALWSRVECPILVTIGTQEDTTFARSLGEVLNVTLEVVDGASHHYDDLTDVLGKRIVDWLDLKHLGPQRVVAPQSN